jgi:hypothetical protein
MNKTFVMYHDIIPNEDLGLEFKWKKRGGAYSEEIEDRRHT